MGFLDAGAKLPPTKFSSGPKSHVGSDNALPAEAYMFHQVLFAAAGSVEKALCSMQHTHCKRGRRAGMSTQPTCMGSAACIAAAEPGALPQAEVNVAEQVVVVGRAVHVQIYVESTSVGKGLKHRQWACDEWPRGGEVMPCL